jgi:predicted Zn-dependent peptidase
MWTIPIDLPTYSRVVFTSILRKILFNEIREKRSLAYSIDAETTGFRDIDVFRINSEVNCSATSRISDLVMKCVSKVKDRKDLFENEIQSRIQGCYMCDPSGSGLIDNSVDDIIDFHRIITMKEVLRDIRKVTFDQVLEFTKYLTPERRFEKIFYP